MSDTMLHAVLCIPPELWDDGEVDKIQRYSRYLEASRRIEDDEREISRLQGQRQDQAVLITKLQRVAVAAIRVTRQTTAERAYACHDELIEALDGVGHNDGGKRDDD